MRRELEGILFDLLMAVMNSLETWSAAAHDHRQGLAWRDAVTARMAATGAYAPYEDLVAEAAAEIGLPRAAPSELFARWSGMEPWPDATALYAGGYPDGTITIHPPDRRAHGG